MASKQDKSAAIRRLLDKEPGLTPAEIQDELAARAIKVTRNLCKVVRHRYQSVDKPKGQRPHRSDELKVSGVDRRLKEVDHDIRHLIGQYVSASQLVRKVPIDALEGRIYSLPKVRQYLNSVKTWRAKHRRRKLLQQFIDELRVPVTNIEKTWTLMPLENDDQVP